MAKTRRVTFQDSTIAQYRTISLQQMLDGNHLQRASIVECQIYEFY